MNVIDAHLHDPEPTSRWPGGDEIQGMALSCELAIAAMDAVGVDIAAVNEIWPGWCEFAVNYCPDRFVGVANVDHRADDIDSQIASLRRSPRIVALRAVSVIDAESGTGQTQSRRPQMRSLTAADIRANECENLFKLAARYGYPLGLPTSSIEVDSVDAVQDAVDRHPELTFVLDHVGLPQPPLRRPDAMAFGRLPRILTLASYPNVVIKLSGLTTLSATPYPHADLLPVVRQLLESFGPSRLMWGSDYTRYRMQPANFRPAPRAEWLSSYADSLKFITDSAELTEAEKEHILGGTFRQVHGLPDTTT
jgi:L-fuconolactonase